MLPLFYCSMYRALGTIIFPTMPDPAATSTAGARASTGFDVSSSNCPSFRFKWHA